MRKCDGKKLKIFWDPPKTFFIFDFASRKRLENIIWAFWSIVCEFDPFLLKNSDIGSNYIWRVGKSEKISYFLVTPKTPFVMCSYPFIHVHNAKDTYKCPLTWIWVRSYAHLQRLVDHSEKKRWKKIQIFSKHPYNFVHIQFCLKKGVGAHNLGLWEYILWFWSISVKKLWHRLNLYFDRWKIWKNIIFFGHP